MPSGQGPYAPTRLRPRQPAGGFLFRCRKCHTAGFMATGKQDGGTFSPRPALTLRLRMTDEDDLAVINFKTLAMAAAVLSSVVFAMPTSSRAMPQAAPVKIDAASNGNLVQVHYRRYCRNGRCYVR